MSAAGISGHEGDQKAVRVVPLSVRSALHFAAMHNATLPATMWYPPVRLRVRDETTRVHQNARWGGGMAARGPCAAVSDTGHWIPSPYIARNKPRQSSRFS